MNHINTIRKLRNISLVILAVIAIVVFLFDLKGDAKYLYSVLFGTLVYIGVALISPGIIIHSKVRFAFMMLFYVGAAVFFRNPIYFILIIPSPIYLYMLLKKNEQQLDSREETNRTPESPQPTKENPPQ